MRSTIAPETSAVVMMQKVAWKAKKTMCGIVWPARGSKPTSCRKAKSRPDQLAALEKASASSRTPPM